jgi:chorismate mutase/prephenate dehydratase
MPWEFVMFVDFEGHRATSEVAAALSEAATRTVYLKVLGSYPAS